MPKVIYPFYQYGEYETYEPNSADYYLPGTTVKGALARDGFAYGTCMVDDIPISNRKNIILRNIYKVQHLNKEERQAEFGVFFKNVGVEMLKADADADEELKGELYLNGIEPEEILDKANQSTKIKMRQMLAYLEEVQREKSRIDETLSTALCKAIPKLADLINDKNIILIGGYKGLLHSLERTIEQRGLSEPDLSGQEKQGAIFLDPETMRPHGLAKIEFI